MLRAPTTSTRPALRVVDAGMVAPDEPPIGALVAALLLGLPRLAFLAVALTTSRLSEAFAYELASVLGFFLFPVTAVTRAVSSAGPGRMGAVCAAAVLDAFVFGASIVWLGRERPGTGWA